jgi:uncharacterized protein with HEPN domain
MQPKTPKLLDDIRDAGTFIRQATDGKTLDDYRVNRLLRQAVERNFEIIGEAVRRLAEHDPATAARIGECPQIISFRNLLIHGYDLIDDQLVWQVIQSDLPILIDSVQKLLNEQDAAGLSSGAGA